MRAVAPLQRPASRGHDACDGRRSRSASSDSKLSHAETLRIEAPDGRLVGRDPHGSELCRSSPGLARRDARKLRCDRSHAALVALVAAATLVCFGCSDEDPSGSSDPSTSVAPAATDAESPGGDPPAGVEPARLLDITEIRRLAGGRIGIVFRSVTQDASPELRDCEWIVLTDSGEVRSGPAPLAGALAIDPGPHADGAPLRYRIVCRGADDVDVESAERELTYLVRAEPPAPTALEARWLDLGPTPAALVTWSQPASRAVRGFAIRARAKSGDERDLQLLSRSATVTGTRHVLTFADAPVVDIEIEVVALDSARAESMSARTNLPRRGATIPAPAGVRVERGEGPSSPVVVSWEYADARAVGFRVFDGPLQIADETTLGSDARRLTDAVLAPGHVHRYAVAAVEADGGQSPVTRAPPIELPASDVAARPRAPSRLAAEWAERDGRLAIRATWAPAPDAAGIRGYAIEVDLAAEGALARADATISAAATEHTIAVDTPRSYSVRLVAIGLDGTESVPADAAVPELSSLLPPARLVRGRVDQDAGGVRIEWTWRYPALPGLRGFRIRQGDAILADEQVLSATSRAWTTPLLGEPDIYAFRIDAVLRDGSTSPPGPIAQYLYQVE